MHPCPAASCCCCWVCMDDGKACTTTGPARLQQHGRAPHCAAGSVPRRVLIDHVADRWAGRASLAGAIDRETTPKRAIQFRLCGGAAAAVMAGGRRSSCRGAAASKSPQAGAEAQQQQPEQIVFVLASAIRTVLPSRQLAFRCHSVGSMPLPTAGRGASSSKHARPRSDRHHGPCRGSESGTE